MFRPLSTQLALAALTILFLAIPSLGAAQEKEDFTDDRFPAGAVGVHSPCVRPLVPVVASSAATAGRSAVLYLAEDSRSPSSLRGPS